MIPILDSNIIIDSLNGSEQAQQEIAHYYECGISIVTWIEVMAGIVGLQEQATANDYMRSEFIIHYMDDAIAARAASIRRKFRCLKLPDAIIWATAMQQNTLLVTRNSKDFPKDEPSIRIPYTLPPH